MNTSDWLVRATFTPMVEGLLLGVGNWRLGGDADSLKPTLTPIFVEHRGATLTREELLNEVWGYNAMPDVSGKSPEVWLNVEVSAMLQPRMCRSEHGLEH